MEKERERAEPEGKFRFKREGRNKFLATLYIYIHIDFYDLVKTRRDPPSSLIRWGVGKKIRKSIFL
jgi:hypothetical protein